MPDSSAAPGRTRCPECGGAKEPGRGRRICDTCRRAPTQTCSRCKQTKRLAEFYRSSSKHNGRQTTCRECQDALATARRLADPAHAADLRRKRRESDPAGQNAYHRAWYAANAQSQRARVQNYRKRNPEKVRAYRQCWYRENRERSLERSRRYFREHPEWAREVKHRYRVERTVARIAPITAGASAAKWAYWGGLCWLCGDKADTWDHVKPITKGGTHCLANMRPACRSCNSRKGNRWWPTARAA